MPDTAPTPRRNWFVRLADDLLGLRLLGILIGFGLIRIVPAALRAGAKALPSLTWLWTGLWIVVFLGIYLIIAALVYRMYRSAVAGLRHYEGVRKIDKRIW